jgi:hypothetical protein
MSIGFERARTVIVAGIIAADLADESMENPGVAHRALTVLISLG